jgi:hypothetical protein
MRLWFRQSAFPSRQLVQKRPVSGERLVAALRPRDDAVPPDHERAMLEDLFPGFARAAALWAGSAAVSAGAASPRRMYFVANKFLLSGQFVMV